MLFKYKMSQAQSKMKNVCMTYCKTVEIVLEFTVYLDICRLSILVTVI